MLLLIDDDKNISLSSRANGLLVVIYHTRQELFLSIVIYFHQLFNISIYNNYYTTEQNKAHSLIANTRFLKMSGNDSVNNRQIKN